MLIDYSNQLYGDANWMAAFDTPLVNHLLNTNAQRQRTHSTSAMPISKSEAKSTILAQFPPGQQPIGTTRPQIPDTKTNLLDSTPPQIVRALGQAEALIRGLNFLLGLLTWSSGQDWLSFFLVVGWWIVCLYGGSIVKYAGNFIPVLAIAAWYALQKTGDTAPERTSTHASLTVTLKEIDSLRTRITLFLTPPSLLLPYLHLPASQQLLLRLCFSWPVWLLITHKILPPRKITLIFGTAVLCWSAPWARVICIALWRSRTIRNVCGYIIGQDLLEEEEREPAASTNRASATSAAEPEKRAMHDKKASTSNIRDVLEGGIKITQTLYQSQRRWIGIGWTSNLFPTERSAWADETEHAASSIDDFKLPADKTIPHTLPSGEKAHRVSRWKWVDTEWKPVVKPKETDAEGWIYTDNTWKNPGPSEAFGKYTRRRKFLRTAELTEEIIPVTPDTPNSQVINPIITSPRVAALNQHVEPTSTMRMEIPSTSSSPPVNLSQPSAVRTGDVGTRRTSIENDIREAIGLRMLDGEANSTGEKDFGTTS